MPKQTIQSVGCTATFDKDDPKQLIQIDEEFGGTVTVSVLSLAHILQEYGDFKAPTNFEEWRGLHGTS